MKLSGAFGAREENRSDAGSGWRQIIPRTPQQRAFACVSVLIVGLLICLLVLTSRSANAHLNALDYDDESILVSYFQKEIDNLEERVIFLEKNQAACGVTANSAESVTQSEPPPCCCVVCDDVDDDAQPSPHPSKLAGLMSWTYEREREQGRDVDEVLSSSSLPSPPPDDELDVDINRTHDQSSLSTEDVEDVVEEVSVHVYGFHSSKTLDEIREKAEQFEEYQDKKDEVIEKMKGMWDELKRTF
jgi:hypothetical protein